ncbi:MAG: asparaginase [Anaerolineaceae bacterium]|nr:asparaginase [Anaerolineaceae bacterium]
MSIDQYQAVVEATRGPIVECVHFGQITVVDSTGKLLASCGDPELVTFIRSSAKPLQVLSLVEDGGLERFDFSQKELAIMCASHYGAEDHINTIQSIQQKIGLGDEALLCGVHEPLDKDARESMHKRGERPGSRHHQCSGKHMGMLANTLLHGFSIENYISFDHDLQYLILNTLAEIWEMPKEDIILGVDGCSAPVFAIPMKTAALGFARMADPVNLSEKRAAACRKITAAMGAHPLMVAGEKGFDTELMRVTKGKVIAKTGADGYQMAAILPGVIGKDSPGMSVVIKISDGDPRMRSRSLVTLEVLKQLGAINDNEVKKLASFYSRPLHNWRKIEIGELKPCFELKWYG